MRSLQEFYVSNRQDAYSTKSELFCVTGILPVHKRLVENGAISEFNETFHSMRLFFNELSAALDTNGVRKLRQQLTAIL